MGRVVLNDPQLGPSPATANAQTETLVARMLGAVGAATDQAGRVDYRGLRGSDEFTAALESARGLANVRLDTLTSHGARLAFWINVYNALVLHAIVGLGARRSVAPAWN